MAYPWTPAWAHAMSCTWPSPFFVPIFNPAPLHPVSKKIIHRAACTAQVMPTVASEWRTVFACWHGESSRSRRAILRPLSLRRSSPCSRMSCWSTLKTPSQRSLPSKRRSQATPASGFSRGRWPAALPVQENANRSCMRTYRRPFESMMAHMDRISMGDIREVNSIRL